MVWALRRQMYFSGFHNTVVLASIAFNIISGSNGAPKTIFINETGSFHLDCQCDQSYICVAEWKHEDKCIMIHDRKVETEKGADGYTSKFVNETDSYRLEKFIKGTKGLGNYFCHRFTQSGKLPIVAWNVQYRNISYSFGGGNTTAVVGGSVILECSANTSLPVIVNWKHNGTLILQHDSVQAGKRNGNYTSRIVNGNMTAQLEISFVTLNDAGNYTCLLNDTKGKFFTTLWTLHIEDKGGHTYTKTVSLGRSANITCILDKSSEIVSVNWYNGSNEILHHDAKEKEVTRGKYTSTFSNDGSIIWLNISFIAYADEGEYFCLPYLRNGRSDKSTWVLKVEGDQNKEKMKVVAIGDSVELDCDSDIFNVASYQWIRNVEGMETRVIKGSNDTNGLIGDSPTSFIILNASFQDAGNYFCFSYGENDKVQETFWTLQIQGLSNLTLNASSYTENDTFGATCCVEFGMKPLTSRIFWLLDDRKYDSNRISRREEEKDICTHLHFIIARSHHRKTLECWVQNELNKSLSATLDVFYSPDIFEIQYYPYNSTFPFSALSSDEAYITCSVDANPAPNVTVESKSTKGVWEPMSRKPHMFAKNGTITEWKLSLSDGDNNFYRCVAFNGYGDAEISREIAAHRHWPSIFNGIGGIVLMVVITCVGVMFIVVVCFKIAVQLKGIRSRYSVSTCPSSRPLRQTKRMTCSPVYENQAAMKRLGEQTNDGLRDIGPLVGDENYSLVRINEENKRNGDIERSGDCSSQDIYVNYQQPKESSKTNGQGKSRKESKNIHRKPTPKPKSKQRLRKSKSPCQRLNEKSVDECTKENVLYSTVNKQDRVPTMSVVYATVEKDKCPSPTKEGASTVTDRKEPGSPTKAELMYAKVKKNKVWRTEL